MSLSLKLVAVRSSSADIASYILSVAHIVRDLTQACGSSASVS